MKRNAGLRLAAPVFALGLALTACNSDSDSDSDAKDDKKPSQSASQQPADDQEQGGDKELGTGQPATDKFQEDDGTITYQVLAKKVDIKSAADTAKMLKDPKDAKGRVAVTAQVEFTNKGGGTVKRSPKVDDNIQIYADGQRGGLLIFAPEDSPGCEKPYSVKEWGQGQKHTFCDTYMIPENAKTIEVRWSSERNDTDPYRWQFPNK
ncbi:hypothetical protein [Streptomyces sp. NPDC005438]|uniref:hypothetical protein n=1 Tax=Streptomyces sp. NPDC005438 TaxID=3156880 RepID=UPI0033B39543